ncbi:hypothetical protein PaeBR_14240 [Paenibacillus sp. BR2-3]|uniref:hypothetical protein n=1 Tax=Paenibacillus sp. BR2-3 TaxID=3048494 RepID=UPI0039774686
MSSRSLMVPLDVYLDHFMTEDVQTGTQHWTYSFTYLPYDSMKVRFVLDDYSLTRAI